MKRQYYIEDYSFINGNIEIIFNITDKKDTRSIIISESDFENFIEKRGDLEYFTDEWDRYTESHYTKEHLLEYNEWLDKYFTPDDLMDFLEVVINKNGIPELVEE